MKHLEGIRSFKTSAWDKLSALYSTLTGGQTPFAFVITCSDSRYYAELIMQAKPGDLFVQQKHSTSLSIRPLRNLQNAY
jgi:carbonic anhydrase